VEREKVIKGLTCCSQRCCTNDEYQCPYNVKDDATATCMDLLSRDALELLKAQGPRVLTLDELRALPDEPQVPLVMEERVPIGTWDGGSVVKWCGSLFIQEEYVNDGTLYTNPKTYGKFWRVWTAWPHKAKREATPWKT